MSVHVVTIANKRPDYFLGLPPIPFLLSGVKAGAVKAFAIGHPFLSLAQIVKYFRFVVSDHSAMHLVCPLNVTR